MRIFKLGALCCAFFLLSNCATLSTVAINAIPAKRTNQVSAQIEKWLVLGVGFNNDYVDELYSQLESKCVGGKIQGILTKDETYLYPFVHKRVLNAKGYCIK